MARRNQGRPSRHYRKGERVPLSYRITPTLKRALDKAAAASGRSLSQESEYRLQASFNEDQLVERIFSAAAGRRRLTPAEAAKFKIIGQAPDGTDLVMPIAGGPAIGCRTFEPTRTFARDRSVVNVVIDAVKRDFPTGEER